MDSKVAYRISGYTPNHLGVVVAMYMIRNPQIHGNPN